MSDIIEMRQEGELIKVEMEIRLPAAATPQQVKQWIEYETHRCGSISNSNPLLHHEMEVFGGELHWDFTGYTGREEKFDERPTERGVTYRVRYVRERLP